jgi:nicotinate-nucleotide--dimethylbenzimidazole phosphoribosyltransferase
MTTFRQACAAIQPPDTAAAEQTRALLDRKTKPRGSLGRLEELACQLAAIAGTSRLELPVKAIVVMGGDHGVAEDGVSAYPQEVTAQMLLNFARGGAAINVLARQAGAEVVLVDMGVKSPLPALPEIRSHRLAPGTDNFTRGAAMTRELAIAAIEIGIGIAGELADRGVSLIGLGEMGIGNSTAASALTAALTGAAPEEVIGRGTGVDEAGLRRKLEAVRRGLAINRPDAGDGLGALAKLGGFEIAGLCGVALGAAARRVPVLVDGFICGAAALCAVRIAPACSPYLIASHRSVEAGHRIVLHSLGTRPLLDLELRLGEGTGAALAMGLVEASVRILREMATFDAAGVSDSGA